MLRGFLKILIMEGLLTEDMSGYGLMDFIKQKTGKKPSPGSVYPLLKTLNEKNIISYKKIGVKKIYRLTKKGKNAIIRFKIEKEEIINRCQSMNKILDKVEASDLKCPDINESDLIRNSDLLKEFNLNLTYLMKQNDFKKKEQKIRGIINQANNKLKRLRMKN